MKAKMRINIIELIIDNIKVILVSDSLVDRGIFRADWLRVFWILNPLDYKI